MVSAGWLMPSLAAAPRTVPASATAAKYAMALRSTRAISCGYRLCSGSDLIECPGSCQHRAARQRRRRQGGAQSRDRAHARAATSESPGRPARRCRDRGARPRPACAGHRRNGRSGTGPWRGDGDPLHEPRYQDPRLDHRLVHRDVRDQGRILPRRLGRRHLQGAGRGRCRPAAGRHRRRLGRGRPDAHEGARHPQALPVARHGDRARRAARPRRLLGGRPADPGDHPVQHAGGGEPARHLAGSDRAGVPGSARLLQQQQRRRRAAPLYARPAFRLGASGAARGDRADARADARSSSPRCSRAASGQRGS